MTLDSTILAAGISIMATAMGTVFVFVFKSISEANGRLKALELKTDRLEKSEERHDQRFDSISNKQDQKFEQVMEVLNQVKADISDLRVDVQNKQNR